MFRTRILPKLTARKPTVMVSVGFTRSFVLLGFLFMVTHGMRSTFAQARQGFQPNGNDLVLPVHKELHGSNLPAPGEGRPGFDGRKMMARYEALRSDGDEKKRAWNGENYPGIPSGNNGQSSMTSLDRAAVPSNNQKSGVGISRSEGASHPPTTRDTSDQASWDPRPPMSDQLFSQGSSPPPVRPRHHQTNPMEAAEARTEDEIANLMRKDYRGPPKAKRKPPINNHEPSN